MNDFGTWKTNAHLFTQQRKVGLVRAQAQHHEISIESVEAVASINIVVGLAPLIANEFHDFVLTLAWNLIITIMRKIVSKNKNAVKDFNIPGDQRAQLESSATKDLQKLSC